MATTNETYLFVVPCGANKLDQPAPARDLYTGSYFREVLAGAEAEAAATTDALGVAVRVMILSAAHGLVDLDDVLDPYDITMTGPASVSVDRLALQLRDLAVDDLEVYAFLPRAYHDRLRAAADLAFDTGLVEDLVLVHDVYEAAPGIGYHKAVAANLRTLPTTTKGSTMTGVNIISQDENGTVFTLTDPERTLGEFTTWTTDLTPASGPVITLDVLGFHWVAVPAMIGTGPGWTTEFDGYRWFVTAPDGYESGSTTWTLTSEVEAGVEVLASGYGNVAVVHATRCLLGVAEETEDELAARRATPVWHLDKPSRPVGVRRAFRKLPKAIRRARP